MGGLVFLLITAVLSASPAQLRGPKTPAQFTTPLALEQMTNKQAVVHTSAGTFVIDLRPDLAPNHVGYFIMLAGDGAYTRTTFHRVIRHGIIQGGDPISKDPAKAKLYGTGGLGMLKAEITGEPATRGTVAAVIQPGKPDSAGAQFFVCVTDQPAVTGKYSVFGRVSEGMDVVQRISEAAASPEGVALERVEIASVTIRDAPPPEPEPFSTESAAELAAYRAVLETTHGPITIQFLSEKAPGHVRAFLRLASAGVFDGTAFHRVVRGFVIQTGSLDTRGPLAEKQQKVVRTLAPEFNDTRHARGIVSMARGDDPASATTSFFIVTGDAPSLDGKYTAFGRVADGMSVVDAIEQSPVTGETPVTRIDLKAVRIVRTSDLKVRPAQTPGASLAVDGYRRSTIGGRPGPPAGPPPAGRHPRSPHAVPIQLRHATRSGVLRRPALPLSGRPTFGSGLRSRRLNALSRARTSHPHLGVRPVACGKRAARRLHRLAAVARP